MTSSIEKHIELIKKAEAEAAQDFESYRRKVVLLALGGYAYIWTMMIVLIVMTALVAMILLHWPWLLVKAGIPLILAIGLIVRSFWIKNDPVRGIKLERSDAPELIDCIKEIGQKVKAPTVHEVLLVPDLNAMVVQMPRLGLLGWYKNHVVVGLEMMQVLTYEEFRAVLAHEMGHLSSNHGKISSWIYGARTVWAQLLQSLSNERSFAVLLFTRFFNWYVPLFDAYTFALRRGHEYEADRCSVEVEGADAAATGLIKSSVLGRFLSEKYWKGVLEAAADSKEPPAHAFQSIPTAISTSMESHDKRNWLTEALDEKTDYYDSHPALTERLSAILGQTPDQVRAYAEKFVDGLAAPQPSAAEMVFGSRLPAFVEKVEQMWATDVAFQWALRHEALSQAKKSLLELEEKAKCTDELSGEDLKELAYQTAQLAGFQQSLPFFRQALKRFPDDADLRFVFAQWLVEEKNEEALEHIEKVMKLDRRYGLEACRLALDYLYPKRREEECKRFYALYDEFLAEQQAAQLERSQVVPSDILFMHGLSEADVKVVQDACAQNRAVKKAWLLQKKVKYYPNHPFYVIVLELSGGLRAKTDQEIISEVAQAITFPHEAFVGTKSMLSPAQVVQCTGAEVYPPVGVSV